MPTSAILARYPDLAGRTVFVSGGGSGIGAAFVRAFAGQSCKVAFIDIAEAPSRSLAAELGAAVRYWPCDVRDIGCTPGRDRRSRQGFRCDPRARQQRRARRPAQVRRRDPRVLGRQPGRQPAAPLLRRAGGCGADGRRGRRLDHQPGLRVVDARTPRACRLHDGQGSDQRTDANARARARHAQHPRQLHRSRRHRHRAAARVVVLAGTGAEVHRAAMPQVPVVRGQTSPAPHCFWLRTRRAASPDRI